MKKNNRKGFTITELVIVIAVIAILAAVLIPTFTSIINKANDSADLQEARATYTEWMAEHDYTTGAPADDVIVKVGDSYLVVVDNSMDDEVYDSYDAAQAAITLETGYEWPATAAEGVNVPVAAEEEAA